MSPLVIIEIKNLEKSVSEATDSHLSGIGTLKIQVAGLHRASPSTALDKKIVFKSIKRFFVIIMYLIYHTFLCFSSTFIYFFHFITVFVFLYSFDYQIKAKLLLTNEKRWGIIL